MAEREKIALCLEYPIEQFGGTEILVRELVRGLSDRYRITLVSTDDENSLRRSTVADKIDRHIRWNSAQITAESSQQLAQTLFDSGIKLAHFHFAGNYAWGNRYFYKSPILFLEKLGVPCFSTNHGAFSIFDGYCGPQRSVFFKAALFLPAWLNKLRVLARLKTEVAVSQHDYHALQRWYWPLRSKFRQLYHSQLHVAPGTQPAPVVATADRAKAIICVGTVGLRKGQVYLVDAFSRIAAQFPEWKLIVIGRHSDDGMSDRVQDLITQHKLFGQVLLLEKCSDEEVNEWMRTAAIFAMPSLMEGLGLSLQEAQFNGCTCIGSRVGGIPELIEHERTGLLVEPANAADLAQGLAKLISNPALRETYSRNGAASILEKGMTAEQMTENYAKLYDSLIKKS